MRIRHGIVLGLLGLLWCGPVLAPPRGIRVFQTQQEFHDAVGRAVDVIDFERLPAGSLSGDTYRDRGVIIKTDQPSQAHRTARAPSLSVEEHIGDTSTKILVSDAIPVAPHALTIQFPPGTKAAGCFLVATADQPGAQFRVEAWAGDGSRQQVEITASAERNEHGHRHGERRDPSDAKFIGFASNSGISKLAIWVADDRRAPAHNFGIDDITFARK